MGLLFFAKCLLVSFTITPERAINEERTKNTAITADVLSGEFKNTTKCEHRI